MSEQAQRRLVTDPVTGRRTSTEKAVTARIAMRNGVTGKEFTLTSWKTEIEKCRRSRTTWTLCKRRTGEAIPRAANFGGESITAEHKVSIETLIRETITEALSWCKFWQLKDPWWNKTSQGRHGIIPWNLALICAVDHGIIEKSKSTPHRSKRFEIAEKRYAELRKEPLRNCCNWPLDGGWIPWWIATICEKYLRKGASTNQLNQRILCVSLEWISLHFCVWHIEIPPIREHSINPNHSSNTSGTRGEKFGKELLSWHTLSRWTKIDASEFHNVKLNAKEMISPKLETIPKNRRWTI